MVQRTLYLLNDERRASALASESGVCRHELAVLVPQALQEDLDAPRFLVRREVIVLILSIDVVGNLFRHRWLGHRSDAQHAIEVLHALA